MADTNLGERIRVCREACGYSQAWLAKALGVDRSTVFRYESGATRRIPMVVLDRIAELLGTNRQYLLYGETSTTDETYVPAEQEVHYLESAPIAYDMLYRESQLGTDSYEHMRTLRAFRFLVESDSLSPRIMPGDLLTVEVCDELQNQRIHLLIQNDHFVLRRISCEGSVVILMANDGTAEILDQDKLRAAYRIVGYVTQLSSTRP